MLVSVPLFLEYEAVLMRADRLRRFGLGRDETDVVLDVIAARARRVRTSYLWRPQLRNPADEMVLETAVNGGADSIVTFNRRDFETAPARFGIDLLGPADLLRRNS